MRHNAFAANRTSAATFTVNATDNIGGRVVAAILEFAFGFGCRKGSDAFWWKAREKSGNDVARFVIPGPVA